MQSRWSDPIDSSSPRRSRCWPWTNSIRGASSCCSSVPVRPFRSIVSAELLAAVPEVEQVASVEAEGGAPHEVATLDSLCRLAQRVNELLQRPDLDGLVFVQGTNTLEETAYFLTLTVRSAKPVVVTGAQRPFTALSSDAPRP